jgi:cytochrome c
MRTFILFLILFFGSYLFANEGEKLYDLKCSMCHIKTKPTKEMKKNFIAPPISGIMKNVKRAFPDDKEGVEFIKEYVISPSLEKSKCKTKAIERFGLMPSQKENLSLEELEKIAYYLYENFPLSKTNKKK